MQYSDPIAHVTDTFAVYYEVLGLLRAISICPGILLHRSIDEANRFPDHPLEDILTASDVEGSNYMTQLILATLSQPAQVHEGSTDRRLSPGPDVCKIRILA